MVPGLQIINMMLKEDQRLMYRVAQWGIDRYIFIPGEQKGDFIWTKIDTLWVSIRSYVSDVYYHQTFIDESLLVSPRINDTLIMSLVFLHDSNRKLVCDPVL